MICDVETNYADLTIAAINSIRGYYKKNNLSQEDVPVCEVIESDSFAPWTKTILWNAKNKKGSYVSKRKNITVSSVSLTEDCVEVEDNSILSFDDLGDCVSTLIDKCKSISFERIDELCDNPSMLDSDTNLFGENYGS